MDLHHLGDNLYINSIYGMRFSWSQWIIMRRQLMQDSKLVRSLYQFDSLKPLFEMHSRPRDTFKLSFKDNLYTFDL